ncbi:hypothetical protein HYW83_01515 [Candidatus Peregrinibacteria bacterium]|nr:hypothetical protein [Candidatus Peregrinibacteria bacterium]
MQLKRNLNLLIYAAVFALPIVVFAASEYNSDSNIAAGVIGTVSSGATYELSPSKLFSFDSNFGQDLYELTYNRVKSEASDKAAERVLADRKISKEELFAVVPGANIGKLLTQPEPTKKLNPAEVEKRRLDLQRFLAEEKELADLELRTTIEVQPTEFFSNGDESDSGFDLIVDLNIIEYILFGKVEATMSNAGPGAPAGSNVVGVGLGGGGGAEEPVGGSAGGGGAGAGAGAGGGGAVAGAGGSSPVGSPPRQGSESAPQVKCPVEESFNNGVEAARAREQIAAAESGASGGAGSGAGDGSSGGGGAGGAGGAGGGAGADGGAEEGEKSSSPVAEPPANWARPRACDGIFCLKIEAVYKKESSFQATDNCIACHFEKTNDAFKKAVSHNLVPSKATGNLIEAPKCKRSMFNLKQNFILIPQPILTPPNDDLITKGDFIKNWIEFTEKYYANPDQCRKLKNATKDASRDLSTKIGEVLSLGQICDPKPNVSAEAAKREVEQAGEDTEAGKILTNIATQVEAKKQEAAATLKQYKLQRDAGNQATQFNVLLQEIDTMNSYFTAFKNLYDQLIGTSRNEDSPCADLYKKEACS